jgi:3-oxoisoapionate decarboxylase
MVQNEDVASVVRYAQEHGLFITLAASGYDSDTLAEVINLGTRLGVSAVRTVVAGAKIGGDRRPLAGRWQSFLQEILAKLREATTSAERAG